MRTLRPLSGWALLLFLQVAVLPGIGGGRWCPDLLLLATVITALRRGRMAGQSAGFACGLVQGLFSGAPFGAQALLFTLTGFAAGSARHLIWYRHPLAPALFTLPAAIILPPALLLISRLAGQPTAALPDWAAVPATIAFALLAALLPWPATPDRR
ncbi:MAG TPA: rod shape-determining protein MreD [bacterium]|nr:rod shape-determining protein MreD [bacterium]